MYFNLNPMTIKINKTFHYLLAPQLYRLWTIVNCSGIHVPCFIHFTWLTCLPRDLCTEQHSEHMRIPLLTLAQLGSLAPQSAHTDRGCLGLDLLNMVIIYCCIGVTSICILSSISSLFCESLTI